MTFYDSEEFSAKYNFDGKLGVYVKENKTYFSVWVPDARTVTLNVYFSPSGGSKQDFHIKMNDNGHGSYVFIYEKNLHGLYYTYTIDRGNGQKEITDPYAPSSSACGKRGMVVDFSSPDVKPKGWEKDRTVKLKNYCDAVIYEMHVRDFTSKLKCRYPGKYLGVTEKGLKTLTGKSAGLDHIKELGITHVHLLPVAQNGSVDELRLNETDYNSYNWGYDPLLYNSPCGVYATDPSDGRVKVYELRQMIKTLHSQGIGVIMDVVYNHTYNLKNPLYEVLPGYFYRTDDRGNLTDGSGCGNEIASERYMCRKFILDSLKLWMELYHIDGFRFDLMGLTDVDTVREIEKLHRINPSLILYGEGWIGGPSSLSPEKQSSKWNTVLIDKVQGAAGGVAAFSDITRDCLKGPVFDRHEGGYVNGRSYENVLGIKYASMGCTSPNFGMNWQSLKAENCISYVSSHDNYALYDKITYTVSGDEERAKRSLLAGAVVLTSRGVPFFQAGEEMLRSKSGPDGAVENSYNSPDSVNGIEWRRKDSVLGGYVSEEYGKLIKLRKEYPALRISDADKIEDATTFIESRYDIIAYILRGDHYRLLVIYNPLNEYEFALPEGKWTGIYGIAGTYNKSIVIPEISCLVLKQNKSII